MTEKGLIQKLQDREKQIEALLKENCSLLGENTELRIEKGVEQDLKRFYKLLSSLLAVVCGILIGVIMA
jgi:hypothetical protein